MILNICDKYFYLIGWRIGSLKTWFYYVKVGFMGVLYQMDILHQFFFHSHSFKLVSLFLPEAYMKYSLQILKNNSRF